MNKDKFSWAALRVNKKMTLEEASKELGITKDTLCAYENYNRFPTTLRASAMAEFYGKDIGEIKLTGKE